jgi:transposase-like protein
MQCPLCGHDKAHKHGRTPKGVKRFKCPQCNQTFTETFDALYYRRQVSEAEVHTMLQSHSEGASLRGVITIDQR